MTFSVGSDFPSFFFYWLAKSASNFVADNSTAGLIEAQKESCFLAALLLSYRISHSLSLPMNQKAFLYADS
ncbi:MAG: hypothetical protein DI617_08495 [Streptococcus pyogenes]|nr:MAG: hypothetical protein DI617_08495 [Streptococcus pyogenes]